MYRNSHVFPQDALNEAYFEAPSFEDEFEAEDAPLFWYYWEAQHKPVNSGWILKSPSPPQPVQVDVPTANYLDQQALNQAFQTVLYQTGLLYVGRYNWNGTNWYRDRCHMIDLASRQNWSC